MKKDFFSLIILFPIFLSAQETQAELYIQEIQSKIASPSVEQIDLEKGNEHFTAFYFDDKLISLKTSQTGELANKTTKEYFLRNDSLIALRINRCLTSQEILDIDMYMAGHTDKKGITDWSGLPVDCMELNVYCKEKRFTKSVTGSDIFDQPEEISSICSTEESNVKQMVEMLGTETAAQ